MAAPLAQPAPSRSQAFEIKQEAVEPVMDAGQFSDLQPTDWAYQALETLVGRYGCLSAHPQASPAGLAWTRFEAAALLAACLPVVGENTDVLRRLRNEFGRELAVLQGRVDGIEARVGELEAQHFAATTRLHLLTRSVVGAVSYGGNQVNTPTNSWGQGVGALPLRNALSFNYDSMMFLDTSTTGSDLLRVMLRMANFSASAFGKATNNPAPLTQLDAGFEDPSGRNNVGINRLFYRTPINRYTSIVIGPRVRQNDTLPVWPTLYARPGSELLLRIFTQAGSPSAYSLLIGPGAGVMFKDRTKPTGWSAGMNYIADKGFKADTNQGGLGSAQSTATAMGQLSYTGRGWNLSAAVAQNGQGVRQDGTSYWRAIQPRASNSIPNKGATRTFSFAGFWQPRKTGLIPSMSAGVGWNQSTLINSSEIINQQQLRTIQSAGWMAGFLWDDALQKGNQLGFAMGQPTFVTAVNARSADDGNYAFELYYTYRVSDRVQLTPSVFYLSKPRGQSSQAPGMPTSSDPTFHALGALLEITFKI